jgi:UDP-N-acetylglucosamine 1-carboxyvinyltransferase
MCCSLTPEKVIINNIPDIINKLITLLGNLGVKIKNGTWLLYFQADEVNIQYLETEAFKKEGGSLRGSIMIVGPFWHDLVKVIFQTRCGDKT